MTSPTQSAMEQQQREAFEAWARDHSYGVSRFSPHHHSYAASYTQHAWAGWQAALSSQASELRSLRDSLALAKADLERYRWLREVLSTTDLEAQDAAIDALNLACREPTTPDQFDAAIDAARAALNKEQPQ